MPAVMSSRYSRPPNTSLYVRNVPEGTRSEDLSTIFGKYGPLTDVYIPLDYHTQRSRGFAYTTKSTPGQMRGKERTGRRSPYGGRGGYYDDYDRRDRRRSYRSRSRSPRRRSRSRSRGRDRHRDRRSYSRSRSRSRSYDRRRSPSPRRFSFARISFY
ncbi:hypothetical protein KUTeg_018245, partial [Tegillarca granosa]